MAARYEGPSEINPDEIQYDDPVQELGKGKFGKVYAGRLHACSVAVKVPRKQDLSDRELEKFRREVQIMRYVLYGWIRWLRENRAPSTAGRGGLVARKCSCMPGFVW